MAQNNPVRQIRFYRVEGMDCAEEIAILKRELVPLLGSEDRLTFDLLNRKLGIDLTENPLLTEESIQVAIQRTGMRAIPWEAVNPTTSEQSIWASHQKTLLTAVSGLAVCFGWGFQFSANRAFAEKLADEASQSVDVPWFAKLCFAVAILTGSWSILPKAWYAIKTARPDMNLLMVIAIGGAIAIGEWLEGATVAFLFSFSLLLESWSVNRARKAIAALLELSPLTARVVRSNGKEELIPPQQVSPGAQFIVRPGEKIPLDGRVIDGESLVNQAPITGESVPVSKGPASDVFAGTINGDGVLRVECTKPAESTTLAQIIRLVSEAQSQRAPAEQWVEKFARIYTPVVLVVAILVGFGGPLLFQVAWSRAAYQALVFLVIACPCALVISTPVSIVAALAAAARQGVLIKGGAFVEAPAHLRAIAFDKTGTLTAGRPIVQKVVALNGHTEQELLTRANSLEQRSDHPLAQAIVAYAKERGIQSPPADNFQLIQGKGATALFEQREFWLGSHRYLEERGQETPEVHAQLEQLSTQGHSIVVIGNSQHVCGYIALADEIRPGVKQILSELKQLGIQALVMLTGDNLATARHVADQLGLSEVKAELLPQDKVTAIAELNKRYQQVAMVGDGVNDAPALARASVGIAMGAAGSDAAIETADVALLADNLALVPWLIRHSRRTIRVVRQNIVCSLSIKALFVVLSFAGMASLWSAIAADAGASLLVIMNGLRLLQNRVD
ncbi:MAG: heavy metal translocating P-type ATPase [Pirellulales bacterium]|nr:heavy metal translocating P-type ATPase [Pirellulales bacterium]